MAGHSKFANIKHRKSAQDAKRSALFSKLIRDVALAAKQGGGSLQDNAALRSAVDKALGANMKRANIDRAIARATGSGDDGTYERCVYEGYGPGGVALLMECSTDNHKRSVATVRHALSRFGCELATTGSVAYLFERQSHIYVVGAAEADDVFLVAAEAGASDVVALGEELLIVAGEESSAVTQALSEAGFEPLRTARKLVPSTTVTLSPEDDAKLSKLLLALSELDDIEEVVCNRSA